MVISDPASQSREAQGCGEENHSILPKFEWSQFFLLVALAETVLWSSVSTTSREIEASEEKAQVG